jgi:hypothetical protein
MSTDQNADYDVVVGGGGPLLDNAARKGVSVRQECAVADVLEDGDRVCGVRYTDATGSHEVRSRYVMDVDAEQHVGVPAVDDLFEPLVEQRKVAVVRADGDPPIVGEHRPRLSTAGHQPGGTAVVQPHLRGGAGLPQPDMFGRGPVRAT